MITDSITFVGIAPHPPIMVPEVGREAITEVRESITAMRVFTERIIESGAETLLIISPHAPLDERAFVAYADATLYGDFANFRAAETKIELELDEELLTSTAHAAADSGYEIVCIKNYKLDHGTLVPLYFLHQNGWRGRVVALGYSFLPDEDHLRFGDCITRAANETKRVVALVASGDLSHRLKPEAPAGYRADAHLFDEAVVESIRSNQPRRILDIDRSLRARAGECGYRSMLVALGAISEKHANCEVLNYEAPFGVGYLVAQLARSTQASTTRKENTSASDENVAALDLDSPTFDDSPALLARRAVETYVCDGHQLKTHVASSSSPLFRRAACFVSLKTSGGDLRGCIGTIEPAQETLAEEIVANAISAATRDPRFPPVEIDELPSLRYSVDVLSAPEPTEFSELDPSIYGVIVEDESGLLRGLLLPDLAGIKTAEQQVEIAARKAGIAFGATAALKLFRFRVERFRESARHDQTQNHKEQKKADNKFSFGEKSSNEEIKPQSVTDDAADPFIKDERSLDIGESGQFAPGGYYNQRGVDEADRIDLDEYTAMRTPDKKSQK